MGIFYIYLLLFRLSTEPYLFIHCISLYLPTYKPNQERFNRQDLSITGFFFNDPISMNFSDNAHHNVMGSGYAVSKSVTLTVLQSVLMQYICFILNAVLVCYSTILFMLRQPLRLCASFILCVIKLIPVLCFSFDYIMREVFPKIKEALCKKNIYTWNG